MKTKTKLITISLLVCLLFSLTVPLNANWTTTETIIDVENVTLDTDEGGIVSNNNVIFYEEELDRWYILYVKDTDSYDFHPYYSYSDSGDLSTWNNGGVFTHLSPVWLRRTSWNNLVGGYVSWTYDNENNLGHIIALNDHTSVGNVNFRYSNFTINVITGAIEFGNMLVIQALTGTINGQVDIVLSHSNLPIIALSGYFNGDEYCRVWICDSIDGFNGDWVSVYYQPTTQNSQVSLIPTGNNSCIAIYSDNLINNPLHYYSITFGVTANSSGDGTVFSDNSLWKYSTTTTAKFSTFGVAYNITHGLVTYCATDYNAYVFLFDFETETKTDEYCIDDTGTSANIKAFNGGVFETNEAFVTYYTTRFSTSDHDVRANEYHTPLYEGYFNTTNNGAILDDYTTDYSTYSGFGMNTARMTDDNGVNLIMLHGVNGQYVSITYWQPQGEYSEPEPEPEPEIFEPYYVDSNGFFIVGFIICSIFIFVFAVKIKYGNRR